MNKTSIKNFSIEARRKLIASVKDKAGRIGITKDQITESISKGDGFAIFPTHIGIETKLSGKELKQRENLVNKIRSVENGYEQVMEEVAYTWFNRIIAVRFMEVNDYLPSRIRVLSSETKGKFEPDIVTQAPNIELELSKEETENILLLKENNSMNELFRILFIKQCNELGKVLPELFENTSKVNKDYTEILLDLSYTNEDGVIRDLLKIDEADFLEAVEIIGWMYQYYNTEPKALVDAYNGKKKVPKEDVPAKTQLFTPDWIVRYMVENSVGRLWLEGHPNATLKENWEYYLDEVEQEPAVIVQLEAIKENYKNLKLEELKVLDPCMGSGHILVYAFEVLMQIYLASGYSERDAASLIVEKNLYGMDIDDRAYQLAYFAVMMKGRKYDRRFLTRAIQPNLCSINESNLLRAFEDGAEQLQICDRHKDTANYLIGIFRDAKEYGSIIDVEANDYDGLQNYVLDLELKGAKDIFESIWIQGISETLSKLIKQAKILSYNYDVVITNPPYFSGSDMSPKLSEYIKKNYPNSKSDMFAVFIEKCLGFSEKSGLVAMITMHSWMFLSSYEKLRGELDHFNLVNMVHLGARAFEEISGEVVQATSFVFRKDRIVNFNSSFVRLVDYKSETSKKVAYLDRVKNSVDCYISRQENFEKIPGMPISYWVSESIYDLFNYQPSGDIIALREGIHTGKNENFLRYWSEVDFTKMVLEAKCIEDVDNMGVWVPYNKGGKYRKWYGNNDLVIGFNKKYRDEMSMLSGHVRPSQSLYFKKGATWSALSSGNFGLRFYPDGFLFDSKGQVAVGDNFLEIMTLFNTKVYQLIADVIMPTLDYKCGDVKKLPYCHVENTKFYELANENILISKSDWDSFELSWDFSKHPMILPVAMVSDAYDLWRNTTTIRFQNLKSNEEEINRIFIEKYGLKNEVIPTLDDKDVTIYRIVDNKSDQDKKLRYVIDKKEAVITFISYAIGCILGRYSLDVKGLAYAGGEWDNSVFITFNPDHDNIIPITDEEYFSDDIVTRFVEFVKVVYGNNHLEENLDFIAGAIGNKGNTSREVIRNYFLKDFFKDHCSMYSIAGSGKRPIYWLFDSGNENAFKALIYMHRYNEDSVGRVRADYLHKQQGFLENAISQCDVVLESSASPSDKSKAVTQREKLVKQIAETKLYDQAIAHIAHKRISIDLDDGVKVNYAKFQGVEVASEGKKTVKVDLLAKI